jgi:hypothetical protein
VENQRNKAIKAIKLAVIAFCGLLTILVIGIICSEDIAKKNLKTLKNEGYTLQKQRKKDKGAKFHARHYKESRARKTRYGTTDRLLRIEGVKYPTQPRWQKRKK